MRHVAPAFQESVLRRGVSLEQFIGSASRDGEPTIRVFEVRPTGRAFEVWLHEAADLGDEEHQDYYSFIFLEDTGGNENGPLATLPKPAAALEYARSLGAHPDRWTNQGLSQDEYRDFIRAGRPALWPLAT